MENLFLSPLFFCLNFPTAESVQENDKRPLD